MRRRRKYEKGTSVGDFAYVLAVGDDKWNPGLIISGVTRLHETERCARSCFDLLPCRLHAIPIESQQPPVSAQAPTIRVQSSLVLVDVIGQDLKSGLPVRDFKKEDFRIFDNRHEVRIATFDAGARYDT